ncbi:MAG: FAD:protein FMN transferase [Spirochaetaceae bacterium]|nr:FAD:protein FMN transferase [Spirochaetaceae bacterium]
MKYKVIRAAPKGSAGIRLLNALFSGAGFLAIWVMLAGCARPPEARPEFVFGTICTVQLYQYGSSALYGEIFSRLREIEGCLSASLPDSDVSAVNRQAGKAPVKVRPELITVLGAALCYAELSGGAFDPTVGPLVKLWAIGSEDARVPGEDEIAAALSLVNWRDIIINREEGTVFLRRPGMGIDLGAIAKGYAADEAARIIRAAGVPRAVIDLGGNIFAHGEKRDGDPWRIGIQDPLEERGASIGLLEVRNKTVVTSGVYERFLEAGGKRYHHILSTRDGYPVDQGLLSVTIMADRSMDADALSTAAFALGYEEGKALVESAGAGAIFVFDDSRLRAAGEILPMFILNSGTAYRLEGDEP